MPDIDRLYRINDALTALANEFDQDLDDDTLGELTHHVADVLEYGSQVKTWRVVSTYELEARSQAEASEIWAEDGPETSNRVTLTDQTDILQVTDAEA